MTNKEFDKFDRTMDELIKVPHSEIKAKLEAEKRNKKQAKKGKAGNEERRKDH